MADEYKSEEQHMEDAIADAEKKEQEKAGKKEAADTKAEEKRLADEKANEKKPEDKKEEKPDGKKPDKKEESQEVKDAEAKIEALKKDGKDTKEADKELNGIKKTEKVKEIKSRIKIPDFLNEEYKAPTTKKEATPEDLSNKANKYDKLNSTEVGKALITAIESGKDPSELFAKNNVQGIKDLTPEQIYAIEINKSNLTDEKKAEAIKEFVDEKTDGDQVIITNPIRDKLIKDQESKQSDVLAAFSKQSQANANTQKAWTEKADQEIEGELSKLNGTEYYGIKITPEIVEGIRDFIKVEFNTTREDGSLNVPLMVDLALKYKYGNLLIKTNAENLASQAIEEAIDDITRPDSEYYDRERTPTTKSKDEQQVTEFEEGMKT